MTDDKKLVLLEKVESECWEAVAYTQATLTAQAEALKIIERCQRIRWNLTAGQIVRSEPEIMYSDDGERRFEEW